MLCSVRRIAPIRTLLIYCHFLSRLSLAPGAIVDSHLLCLPKGKIKEGNHYCISCSAVVMAPGYQMIIYRRRSCYFSPILGLFILFGVPQHPERERERPKSAIRSIRRGFFPRRFGRVVEISLPQRNCYAHTWYQDGC